MTSQDLRLWLFGDKQLRSVIENFEPDVIFSDGELYGTHIKIAALLNRTRIPLIIHLRGDPWSEYRARFLTSKPPMQLLMSQQYVYCWTSLLLARKVAPLVETEEPRMVRERPRTPQIHAENIAVREAGKTRVQGPAKGGL